MNEPKTPGRFKPSPEPTPGQPGAAHGPSGSELDCGGTLGGALVMPEAAAALTGLERAVLDRMLAGEHPTLEALRTQLAACTVTKRETTGVGFFTSIAVPSGVPRAPLRPRVAPFGDVLASLPSTVNGAGFLLYVDDGVMAMLEGYTFDEAWPEATEGFSLRYVDDGRRRLPFLADGPADVAR